MAKFILVHGGCHGGWCWNKVVPLLEAAGHSALAPDLGGMGDDDTPLKDVTLAGWARDIANLVEAQDEKVVLVGHSRGGIVISEASELVPDKVLGLIYLASVIVPNGVSLIEFLSNNIPAHLMSGQIVDEDGAGFSFDRETARRAFFEMADSIDAEWALDKLCSEPFAPLLTPMTVTDERWGSLPRVSIECSRDNTRHSSMAKPHEHWPCDIVIWMESDHSPFLCKPGELTRHFIEIGAYLEGFERSVIAPAMPPIKDEAIATGG